MFERRTKRLLFYGMEEKLELLNETLLVIFVVYLAPHLNLEFSFRFHIPQKEAILGKLIVRSASQVIPAFYGTILFITATGPYPEADEFHTLTPYSFRFHFNIILSSKPTSPSSIIISDVPLKIW
jgi:hypothetical protein